MGIGKDYTCALSQAFPGCQVFQDGGVPNLKTIVMSSDKTLLLSTEVFSFKFRRTCGDVQTKSDSLFPLHAFPGQEVEQAAMLHVVGDQPQLRPGSIIFVVSGDESEDVVVPEHAGLVDLDLPHPGLLVQAGEDLHRHVAASPLTTPHLRHVINRCIDLQR